MNEFEITGFADDVPDSWLVGRMHGDAAVITVSLVKLLPVSEGIPLFIPLIGVFTGEGESMFDVEGKLLFDDLERFTGDLALEDSSDERIDVFLGDIVTDYFFVIRSCRERLNKWPMVGGCFSLALPFPSFLCHFLLCQRIVFIGDRFIIAERGEFMREEFTPLSGASHVTDRFAGDFFVFFHRIGFVQDAMIVFFERDTSEVVMGIETRDAVEMIAACPVLYAETVVG